MVAPYKVCPKCQSPAPLDATFCGQCGRQYRTQFSPAGVALSAAPPNPNFSVAAPQLDAQVTASRSQGTRGLSFAIVGMSIVVAILILTVVHRGHPEVVGESASHVTQASRSVAPPVAPDSLSKPPATDTDPATDAARGVVERAERDMGAPPSTSATGPDGLVHLRNGGTITREQWDAAAKKVNDSPINHVPVAPPVP